jgi:hypothetical protein
LGVAGVVFCRWSRRELGGSVMHAMNGIRRRWRQFGCVAALTGLAAMTLPTIAAAHRVARIKATYVALGDSLAFGYSQQLFNENELTGENPAGFEHGYANAYLNDVNVTRRNSVQLVNDGCPGETTESLIGGNATFIKQLNEKAGEKVSEPITGEAPCAYHTADGLPLHHEYGGKSQLESVIETIASEKAAGTPVRMISLDIGANDELHTVAKAEAEAKARVEAKVAAAVTPTVEKEIGEKVTKIAKEEVEVFVVEQVLSQALAESEGDEPALKDDITKDAAAYFAAHAKELTTQGEIDALNYFSEHKKQLEEEGAVIAAELGAKYAAEHGLELLKDGEEIALEIIKNDLPAEYAQIDTNIIGILVAIHDTGYTGRVIFVGTYDPYGRVEGVTKAFGKLVLGPNERTELEPGFNVAGAELISLEKATLTKKVTKLKVCYSNTEERFNPATFNETPTAEEEEEQDLAKWTNMANSTEFEYAPGKKLKFDEKVEVAPHVFQSSNGPDIHATPEGYEVMAAQMNGTCAF